MKVSISVEILLWRSAKSAFVSVHRDTRVLGVDLAEKGELSD
jgi:hypothetical protein